ncbi:glycosyltransferase [Bacillus sp. T33-2]|uniref:glycosyltransferase n=1 Tax=Bacillus sp. T33-2 TaxID=2054168 RepID=UPI0015E0E9CA|nr:glycosyltransferase [Bacillus sp. T33-2]
MNNNKVCFIYCVNNQLLLEESLRYIYTLEIPEGFEIDVITIEESPSMAAAYNQAMKDSDAKYKVYLHQDVFIVNKNFIEDMITLFKNDETLGMIGVVGSKFIPPSGVWWESGIKYGKVFDSHTGKMDLLNFRQVQQEFESVQAVDGLLMATQVDIPWREDLFDGWHYYDISQCLEFQMNGYQVGVPNQSTPWCVHDCGVVNTLNGFNYYKSLFLNVYEASIKQLIPLVSILIPTYNRPDYFEQALNSVLNQTYFNTEIIIADDSTNLETSELIQVYLERYSNITYIKNETTLGQFDNDLKLLELANGEFVNFLMDDDLFHPQKIEKMISYYLADEDIKLVTSHRQLINEQGEFIGEYASTKRLFEKDTILDGSTFAEFLLTKFTNYIGEPTTVLFRKRDLREKFGVFNGRQSICNVDLATWIDLLMQGKAVYITETLSYFRIHSDQQLQSPDMLANGTIDFAYLLLGLREKGLFTNDRNYEISLKNWLKYQDHIINLVTEQDQRHMYMLSSMRNHIENVIEEMRNTKIEQAKILMNKKYLDNTENLIIFLVPGENGITGGIISIYSLYEETEKMHHLHNSKTIMCTLPNDTILLKNTNLDNNVDIYPFELVINHFSCMKKCIIHLPESYVQRFIEDISENESLLLQNIPELHINILNQNDELMPDTTVINNLYRFTNNITSTTAHKRYTSIETRIKYGIPVHLFSTRVSSEQYSFTDFANKEDILVVSPDSHPMKSLILHKIKEQFPKKRVEIVQNMKYEDYKNLITRAKWTLTFGEGLDGYFVETILSGGIGLAVYNPIFFTEEFQHIPSVFADYDDLYNHIEDLIKQTSEETNFTVMQREQLKLINDIYNYDEYINNIKNFYLGNYDFK